MKIKTRPLSYAEVCRLPRAKHLPPRVPSRFFRWLPRLIGAGDLKNANFSYTVHGTEKAGGAPRLILMNHSAFIDLEAAAKILADRPYHIVCTSDGFVGKEWLMRSLGCIPTKKFISDIQLIRDMKRAPADILMYPEASYSFDGTATPLPRHLGRLLKMLGRPVMMIRTHGAFLRDPLYNNLQKRAVTVTAEMYCLFSAEEVRTLPESELDEKLDEVFTFDNFAEQRERKIAVTEPFRADGLHRILYKCPCCGSEGKTEGKGVTLTCRACTAAWAMDEYGSLHQTAGGGVPAGYDFTHIPSWYAWERACVREEIRAGSYRLDAECEVGVLADTKALYKVGRGRLTHTAAGFTLTGIDGTSSAGLNFRSSARAQYSLYADYFWYELGDVICIGDPNTLYYCFPPAEVPVAKARLAQEETYKIISSEQ